MEPLFSPEDICVFDAYEDGDNYQDETYVRNFRLILDAIRNKYPLVIEQNHRHGELMRAYVSPEYLEYSEKDDKFRLIASGGRYGNIINLGRILRCEKCSPELLHVLTKKNIPQSRNVIFEVKDERNAMERVLMHFAHFEKEAERIGDDRYQVTLHYDRDDETEMVIRILSFGPLVKVVSPQHFVDLIKERLRKQKSCEL